MEKKVRFIDMEFDSCEDVYEDLYEDVYEDEDYICSEQEDIEDEEDEDEEEDEEDEEDEDEEGIEENLLNSKHKKLNIAEYKKIIKKIKADEPDLIKIVNSNSLNMEDKSHLFQLYEIYKIIPTDTEEFLDLRNKIVEKLRKSESGVPSMDLQIVRLETSVKNKDVLYRKLKTLEHLDPSQDEYSKLTSWLRWALSLPYDKMHDSPRDVSKVLRDIKRRLDEELYGMDNVKEEIMIYLNTKLTSPGVKGLSLGLIGDPGTGKTAISRLLSEILGLPWDQISLGGAGPGSEFLKGHDSTYIGSHPGEIVKSLRRMQYKNGIIVFDEYEKVMGGVNQITAALLHITDPVQNSEFRDDFLSELDIDLSHIWFIYSMNKLPTHNALRDRIHVIQVPGYSNKEKVKIVSKFLLPKSLINLGLKPGSMKITSKVAQYLVEKVSPDEPSGVRSLKYAIDSICRKVQFLVQHPEIKMSFSLGNKLGNNKSIINLTKNMINFI